MTKAQAESSLNAIVLKFVSELQATGALPISAPYVAGEILAGLTHYSVMDEVERSAAYMGIAQVARETLRKSHAQQYDPAHAAQEELALPEAALLNEAYSVMRDDEPVYVPRTMMDRADMEYVCKKFDALAGYYARASRALRADWERRNASAAA